MDSEAVPGIMQARALLAGRSADACTWGDAQEGGDDCAVRAGAMPLIDEEGRFWTSAVTGTTSGVNVCCESAGHLWFDRYRSRLVELGLSDGQQSFFEIDIC